MVVEDRKLTDRARDRHRQLAAGVHPAEQHVGDCMAGLLPEIPTLEERGRILREIIDRERPPVEKHDDGGLMKSENRSGEIFLLSDKIERRAIAEVRIGPALAA